MGTEASALEIVTVVVAGYAALVGTVAFAFQALSWLRSWRTRVEVRCGLYYIARVETDPEPVVLIRMFNHSGHEVKITSVGWGPQKRKGPASVIGRPWPLELPLPFAISPRDSREVWTKPELLDLDSITRFAPRSPPRMERCSGQEGAGTLFSRGRVNGFVRLGSTSGKPPRERLIDVWHEMPSPAGSWKLREPICEIAESGATHDGD
jgi:hypothetical protein